MRTVGLILGFKGVVGCNPIGTKGGLLLFWHANVDFMLRSYSMNRVDVSVCWNSINWRFTGVYVPSNYRGKAYFWDLLRKLSELKQDVDEPWVIGGDFNSVLFNSDKQGGLVEGVLILAILLSAASIWE